MIEASKEQYSDEWWKARRGVPTGSNFARIITPAKGEYSKQADGYISELIADLYDPMYGVVEDYQSAAMKNGTMLEPQARAYYEFERSVTVQEVGFLIADNGRFGASPDGLVGDGCLEIKSPIGKTQVDYLRAGGVPRAYLPQVHGHMLVTDRGWCDFFSYSPGLPNLLVRVERDEFTDKLRACLDQFWDEYQSELDRIVKRHGPPTHNKPDEPVEKVIIF